MKAEHYEAVLTALGEKINSQANTIYWQEREIADLRAKLEAAEKELAGKHAEKGGENE